MYVLKTPTAAAGTKTRQNSSVSWLGRLFRCQETETHHAEAVARVEIPSNGTKGSSELYEFIRSQENLQRHKRSELRGRSEYDVWQRPAPRPSRSAPTPKCTLCDYRSERICLSDPPNRLDKST